MNHLTSNSYFEGLGSYLNINDKITKRGLHGIFDLKQTLKLLLYKKYVKQQCGNLSNVFYYNATIHST